MKHAYLIIAHNNFYILEKLIKLIDDKRNDIYIHIDKKIRNFDFDYYNKFSYCSIPTDSCNAFGIFTDLLTQRILYSLLYMFQKTV